jgi:hypothetical protein
MVECGGIIMASAAQTSVNRLNAQKSTGPRTPEGKAVVSQNAVRHGLLARQVVIKGEDPGEFDSFRAGMLEELAPEGAVEALLAERVVGLSWRLRRAERLQSAVYETVYRENAQDVVLWPKHGLPIEPRPDETEVILGQIVMTDFAHAKVLDRLLVYERRIENSLYRTMAELRRHKKLRESVTCEVSSWKQEVPSRGPALPTSNVELQTSQEASDDATTNMGVVVAPQYSNVPSFHPSSHLSAGGLSCETNPIPWSEGRAERSSPWPAAADQALRSSSTRADGALACQAGFC